MYIGIVEGQVFMDPSISACPGTAFTLDYLFKDVCIANSLGTFCVSHALEGQREDVFLSRIIKISPMRQRLSRFLATSFKRWNCLNSSFLSCDTNPPCAQHPPGLPSTSPAISLGWGRKEEGCECEAHPACHAVSNQAFFFEPRVLYLLPTSVKWGRLIC